MDINQLDLRKLRAFQLVSKHGNLRLAAGRLNQTVPAVSAKIRRLERELGVALFERLPNKLIPTAAGQKFLGEVEAVIERAEQALASLSPAAVPAGRLTVSTASDYAWYIAPRISRFLKRHPGAELELQVHRGADALRALVRGELDVGIGVFPKVPKTLQREVVAETALSLVCPPGHPLLRRRPPRLAEIARHRLIVLPRHGATRQLVERVMAKHSVRPASIIEVANCQTAGTFVEMGVGVAIVHAMCIDHLHSNKIVSVNLARYFGKVAFTVVYRQGTRSALIGAMLNELKS
jgi:DNA-binding transcriptional LysR family regulator